MQDKKKTMNNNPLAHAIRKAFMANVIAKPLSEDQAKTSANTIGNILRHKRICLFEKAINQFLVNSGEKPIPQSSQHIDEKNMLVFSLQLSGYIRDAQKELDNLTSEQACDKNLIKLYQAAAKYSVDCNGKVEGSKYIFREHCDYAFYKIHNHDTLANAKFNNYGFRINPKKRNLILAMPFHIKETQEELQLWSSKFLNNLLDNKSTYNSDVDIYLAHFPIEQPRGEKFALSLKTIANPDSYFEDIDMRFVAKQMTPFLGKDIKVEGNKVVSGEAYDPNTFKENCLFSIVSYCAAGAHAHRWLNAFSHLANQLYEKKTVDDAMKNIQMINYAFMPLGKETSYSGIYFMSNYADDTYRKEPFVKMFSPEIYEQHKCRPDDGKVRFSALPDGRSHIVALKLPENFMVYDENGKKAELPNLENGHHMGIVTQPNANSTSNYAFNLFKSTVENAVLGKRGLETFKIRNSAYAQDKKIPIFYFRNVYNKISVRK